MKKIKYWLCVIMQWYIDNIADDAMQYRYRNIFKELALKYKQSWKLK